MRIISKYKDFYDYLWIDGDPDLTYVRKEKICFNTIEDLIKNDYEHKIGTGIDKWYINDKPGTIDVIGFTFGIYPYVYTSPALSIKLENLSYFIKVISKNEMESMSTLKEQQRREYIVSLLKKHLNTNEYAPSEYKLMKYYWNGSLYNSLKRYCWKQENQDIFLKLNSPIFSMYCNEIISGTVYEYLNDIKLENKNIDKITLIKDITITGGKFPIAMTDFCFNKLNIQINKYWFDEINNLNTYSNIENFLMTSKLDPEPKISNNGKIIAHGFDLKTSFRNM